MKKLLLIIITISILTSCNILNYANAIKKETISIFKEKKKVIYDLGIKGYLLNKNYYSNREYKYELDIKITNISKEIDFFDKQYSSFYEFTKDSIFKIIVSEELYKMINLKDIINKPKFSNEIIINNIYKIMLLSKIEDEWLPPTKCKITK